MQSKPVCSICGHGDPYPWGPSCGGTHSDEYEAALFVSIGGKKIPHNDNDLLIQDLASLVRRMSYAIAHLDNKNPLIRESVEFLKKRGLGGSVLREMNK